FAMAVQPDGKIVAAGYNDFGNLGFPRQQFALARYTVNGHRDPTFGIGGVTLVNVGGQYLSQAHAVALQPDGKIVAAGFANNQFPPPRFTADPPQPPPQPPGPKPPTDLTRLVKLSRGPLQSAGRFLRQAIKITNLTGSVLLGPLALEVLGLN